MKSDGIDLVGGNITSAGEILNISAWVNFNGTGVVAIRDSFNVSSVTDNGVGRYTVNFNTAMVNADYVWTALAGNDAITGTGRDLTHDAARSTSSLSVRDTLASNGTDFDDAVIMIMVVGGS